MAFLFDTHIHLDRLPTATRVTELLASRNVGLRQWLVPGVTPELWPGLMQVVEETTGAWAAPGVHPAYAGDWTTAVELELQRLLTLPKTLALGEIGLDALVATPMPVQEQVLRAQLRLAVAAGLPVLLHCRRATDRLFHILDDEQASRVGGIFHAFSGSLETARAAMRRNLVLGFGGTLTWPGAHRAAETLRSLPAEAIVLETDAPDLTPYPHQGEPNRPAWLTLVAHRVAELRGWSLEETARLTTANACRVLRLPVT